MFFGSSQTDTVKDSKTKRIFHQRRLKVNVKWVYGDNKHVCN